MNNPEWALGQSSKLEKSFQIRGSRWGDLRDGNPSKEPQNITLQPLILPEREKRFFMQTLLLRFLGRGDALFSTLIVKDSLIGMTLLLNRFGLLNGKTVSLFARVIQQEQYQVRARTELATAAPSLSAHHKAWLGGVSQTCSILTEIASSCVSNGGCVLWMKNRKTKQTGENMYG